ncbi:MAG: hypothetical protein ISR44_09855 [Rhodospirillales bacterium]|nr:hypothetical protein [Rhodospirillales bacterium]
MEDTGYGNAMTEIALALAMAFFSIMVLTMISMGVGEGKIDPAVGAVMATRPFVKNQQADGSWPVIPSIPG